METKKQNNGKEIILSLKCSKPEYDFIYNCEISYEEFRLELFENNQKIAESRQGWRFSSYGGIKQLYSPNEVTKIIAERLGGKFQYNSTKDVIKISKERKTPFNWDYEEPDLEIIRKGLIKGGIEKIIENKLNLDEEEK